MARLEVLEGTWEKLVTHAGKFKGRRRLRVIILPAEAEAAEASTDQTTLRETAMRLFSEADTIERARQAKQRPSRKSIWRDRYRKVSGDGIKVVTLMDAGAPVALVDKNQSHNPRCRATFATLSLPLVTTWPAFTEAMYLVTRSKKRRRSLCDALRVLRYSMPCARRAIARLDLPYGR